jgi:hypothetical protein
MATPELIRQEVLSILSRYDLEQFKRISPEQMIITAKEIRADFRMYFMKGLLISAPLVVSLSVLEYLLTHYTNSPRLNRCRTIVSNVASFCRCSGLLILSITAFGAIW